MAAEPEAAVHQGQAGMLPGLAMGGMSALGSMRGGGGSTSQPSTLPPLTAPPLRGQSTDQSNADPRNVALREAQHILDDLANVKDGDQR